eukprot:Amastigsp_a339490_9.p7 type:complete len:103 gc:universal Amastigsp_a339490_9:690-998(+)
MLAFLPPSSSETFLACRAAVLAMISPTAVEPVNETAGTPGCATSGAPHDGPVPKTMLTTPGGTPASLSSAQSMCAVSEVNSDGLHTHVLPAAMHGAILNESR